VPTPRISPLAKHGYVDHNRYDTTSILALIEHRWAFAPLSARDAAANDMRNAFDFSQGLGQGDEQVIRIRSRARFLTPPPCSRRSGPRLPSDRLTGALAPTGARATRTTERAGRTHDDGSSQFDHVVVVMQENRSFDHMLGGHRAPMDVRRGCRTPTTPASTHRTYPLAPDFQGCGLPIRSLVRGSADSVRTWPLRRFLRVAQTTYFDWIYSRQDLELLRPAVRDWTIPTGISAASRPDLSIASISTPRDRPAHNTLPSAPARLGSARRAGPDWPLLYHDLPFSASGREVSADRPARVSFYADCAAGPFRRRLRRPGLLQEAGTGATINPHTSARGSELSQRDLRPVTKGPKWTHLLIIQL